MRLLILILLFALLICACGIGIYRFSHTNALKVEMDNSVSSASADKERVIVWGDRIQELKIKETEEIIYKYDIIDGYCLDVDNLEDIFARADDLDLKIVEDRSKPIFVEDIQNIQKLILGEESEKPTEKKFYKSHRYNKRGTDIAILDTGCAYESLTEINFVRGNSYVDENGHGTAIISIIKDIAPKSNLFFAKIEDKNGYARASDIIAGIDWAFKNNVNIITLNVYNRIGKEDLCPVTFAIENAVKKDVVCVLPAGNSKEDVKNFQPSNSEDTIIVMSCNSKSEPSSFSNWGGDIFVLGEGIVTESIKNSRIGKEMGDEWVKVGGTSFASAEVTGAVAVLKEKNPLLAPDDIKSILWKSSKNKGRYYRGIGELDIEEALKRCPETKEVII